MPLSSESRADSAGSGTSGPLASVVVIPRDRFSTVPASLDSIYVHTREPFELIVVDGGSPPAVRGYLEAAAAARGFTLIATDGFVGANVARNLGLRAAHGRYVVFIENDVIVSEGWLDTMVRCAEETGADIVGPVVLIGEPQREVIHIAGGDVRIVDDDGRPNVIESHFHKAKRLSEVRPLLRRAACGMIEFHCMMVRRTVFDRLGPLDENLTMLIEYIDLCLAVRGSNGLIYFEPDSVVAYVADRDLMIADLPYFDWRRGDGDAERTLRLFAKKWQLPEDCGFIRSKLDWLSLHRSKLTRGRVQARMRSRPGIGLSGTAALATWLGSDALDGPQKRQLNAALAEAARIYSGRIREDGRPWIEHLAGTAALLLDNGAEPEFAAAAMLRWIYTEDAAGERLRRIEPEERARVVRSIGARVERLVAQYAPLDLRPDSVGILSKNFSQLTATTAQLLLIKLAGALEILRHATRPDARDAIGIDRPWMALFSQVAIALHAPGMAAELEASCPPAT